MAMTLTAERLRELLHYDPETGNFTWKILRGRRGRAPGGVAGTRFSTGYWKIGIDRSMYFAHRLAWLYMMSRWPTDQVDHKDGDPSNNRWINLRESTQAHNVRNSRKRKDNTSGFKGVTRSPPRSRLPWSAKIQIDDRTLVLGTFATQQEAHAAYCAAAREHFGEFARFH